MPYWMYDTLCVDEHITETAKKEFGISGRDVADDCMSVARRRSQMLPAPFQNFAVAHPGPFSSAAGGVLGEDAPNGVWIAGCDGWANVATDVDHEGHVLRGALEVEVPPVEKVVRAPNPPPTDLVHTGELKF
ncbi:hypothetical protein [Arthrobacter sp. H5]|uniref:hypothetical protein n=1 Tax=Arthrobacter sp. H5 TaxID=1267973 RepID=UPI0012DF85D6|nr:hypothetical protein [Arthrobacter sp. H5]